MGNDPDPSLGLVTALVDAFYAPRYGFFCIQVCANPFQTRKKSSKVVTQNFPLQNKATRQQLSTVIQMEATKGRNNYS